MWNVEGWSQITDQRVPPSGSGSVTALSSSSHSVVCLRPRCPSSDAHWDNTRVIPGRKVWTRGDIVTTPCNMVILWDRRIAPILSDNSTLHCPHHNRRQRLGAWWKPAQSFTSSILSNSQIYLLIKHNTACCLNKTNPSYFVKCIWMISNFHQSHLSAHSWVRDHRMGLSSVYYDVMISEATLSVSILCVCLCASFSNP